jgi:hypothetical protein
LPLRVSITASAASRIGQLSSRASLDGKLKLKGNLEMFELLEMLEKVLAGLYAPPWDVAFKEWERMSASFSEE